MNLAVVVNTQDSDIKAMLALHCVTLIQPPPPQDISICSVIHNGFFWIVVKFFDPADPGYAAYGILESISGEYRVNFIQFILEAFRESSLDPSQLMQWAELDPVEAN